MTAFEPEKEALRSVANMRRYVDRRQELDKRLMELLAPVMTAPEQTVLDAACGIGHLVGPIREVAPDCRYLGVDIAPHHVEEGRRVHAGDPRTAFRLGDVERLCGLAGAPFDVVICWKALMAMPDLEPALGSLLSVTGRHLFVASLFHAGDIDFHIEVTEHATVRKGELGRSAYNVYSLPRLQAATAQHGARAVHVHPFEIGVDLPRGDPDHMGTYTERLADGRRLQVSGALLMPWMVLRIDR